jgi:hypothetical protein
VIARALLDPDHGEEIPAATTIETVQRGTPVVVEGILQESGFFDPLQRVFFDAVTAVAGAEAAARLREEGVERLHQVCTLDQIAVLKVEMAARVSAFAVPMAQSFVRVTGPGLRDRYFVDTKIADRTMVPKSLLVDHPEFDWAGRAGGLAAYGIHSDSDFTVPFGAVTIWMALGRIQPGNTIALFPRHGGLPVTPALSPGDAVFFFAHDTHGTVENETGESRVAVGFRIVPGRRLRYGAGYRWRPYTDARLADTPLAVLATLQSRCGTAAARRAWSRYARVDRADRGSWG